MDNFVLSQMHIESARNSTDDFNLFHDKHRWQKIANNPFQGAIALGFQLGCFVEDQCNKFNQSAHIEKQFNYSNYELNFAGVVKAGDELTAVIRKGRIAEMNGFDCFTNRVAVKANNKTVLLGYKRQTDEHLITGIESLPPITDIIDSEDRSFIGTEQLFLKRKYMIVGNAKNFLTSAFAEQSEYIDEFIDKVSFPEMYPLSLLSSALLERAQAISHDLIQQPMIYLSHKLSINRTVLTTLKSNHPINILVSPEQYNNEEKQTLTHHCSCVLNNGEILFHAEIKLAPLSSLLD